MSRAKPYSDLAEAPAGAVIVLLPAGVAPEEALRSVLPGALLVKMADDPGVVRNPYPRFVSVGAKVTVNLPFDLDHEYLGSLTAPADPEFHKMLAYLQPAAVEALKDFLRA